MGGRGGRFKSILLDDLLAKLTDTTPVVDIDAAKDVNVRIIVELLSELKSALEAKQVYYEDQSVLNGAYAAKADECAMLAKTIEDNITLVTINAIEVEEAIQFYHKAANLNSSLSAEGLSTSSETSSVLRTVDQDTAKKMQKVSDNLMTSTASAPQDENPTSDATQASAKDTLQSLDTQSALEAYKELKLKIKQLKKSIKEISKSKNIDVNVTFKIEYEKIQGSNGLKDDAIFALEILGKDKSNRVSALKKEKVRKDFMKVLGEVNQIKLYKALKDKEEEIKNLIQSPDPDTIAGYDAIIRSIADYVEARKLVKTLIDREDKKEYSILRSLDKRNHNFVARTKENDKLIILMNRYINVKANLEKVKSVTKNRDKSKDDIIDQFDNLTIHESLKDYINKRKQSYLTAINAIQPSAQFKKTPDKYTSTEDQRKMKSLQDKEKLFLKTIAPAYDILTQMDNRIANLSKLLKDRQYLRFHWLISKQIKELEVNKAAIVSAANVYDSNPKEIISQYSKARTLMKVSTESVDEIEWLKNNFDHQVTVLKKVAEKLDDDDPNKITHLDSLNKLILKKATNLDGLHNLRDALAAERRSLTIYAIKQTANNINSLIKAIDNNELNINVDDKLLRYYDIADNNIKTEYIDLAAIDTDNEAIVLCDRLAQLARIAHHKAEEAGHFRQVPSRFIKEYDRELLRHADISESLVLDRKVQESRADQIVKEAKINILQERLLICQTQVKNVNSELEKMRAQHSQASKELIALKRERNFDLIGRKNTELESMSSALLKLEVAAKEAKKDLEVVIEELNHAKTYIYPQETTVKQKKAATATIPAKLAASAPEIVEESANKDEPTKDHVLVVKKEAVKSKEQAPTKQVVEQLFASIDDLVLAENVTNKYQLQAEIMRKLDVKSKIVAGHQSLDQYCKSLTKILKDAFKEKYQVEGERVDAAVKVLVNITRSLIESAPEIAAKLHIAVPEAHPHPNPSTLFGRDSSVIKTSRAKARIQNGSTEKKGPSDSK